MTILRAAVEQLALGHLPAEPLWFIEGSHSPTRSVWIAVCSDGQVQLRTRALDALPSTLGKGREDFHVEALGTASLALLSWLGQVLVNGRVWELATAPGPQPEDLLPPPAGGRAGEGGSYTLKLALGRERLDCVADLATVRSHARLRSIHAAFCWVRDQASAGGAAPE